MLVPHLKSHKRLTLRSRTVAVAVVALTSLAVAACGSSTGSKPQANGASTPKTLNQLVAAAKKEGGLTLYGVPSTKQFQDYLAAFQKQYGLSGNYTFDRLTSVPLEQRFLTEEKANHDQADVILTTIPQTIDSHGQYFQKMSASLVPSLASYPKSAVSTYGVQFSDAPAVILYNTNNVSGSDVPKTWEDLLNSKFKGQFLLPDPRTAQLYLDWIDGMAKTYGMSFPQSLEKQQYKLVNSGAAAAQQIAAGAADVVAPSFPVFLNSLPKSAPVAYVIPHSPTYVNAIFAGIPNNAPHPATARLFVNWLLTKEGINITCKFGAGNVAYPNGGDGCLEIGSQVTVLTYAVPAQRKSDLFKALGLQ